MMIEPIKVTDDLWQVAKQFQKWVCDELKKIEFEEQNSLRGVYLFQIDKQAKFIVLLEGGLVNSIALFTQKESFPEAAELLSEQGSLNAEIYSSLFGEARAEISTDSQTLKLLLYGQMKAKIAYLTGRVKISGDLPAFLKMISLLKRRGIKPYGV
ncbi:MAG: SCP2 sterol-binding domain-containing protein [Silvanigrellaceae bacterium]|nr:SCP2 sterol-binding domain-containing protein [Silvanigrellaceae bacterium]